MPGTNVLLRDADGNNYSTVREIADGARREVAGVLVIEPWFIYRLDAGGYVVTNADGKLMGKDGKQYWVAE